MRSRVVVLALACAACGRIGFSPRIVGAAGGHDAATGAGDGAAGDAGASDAADAAAAFTANGTYMLGSTISYSCAGSLVAITGTFSADFTGNGCASCTSQMFPATGTK